MAHTVELMEIPKLYCCSRHIKYTNLWDIFGCVHNCVKLWVRVHHQVGKATLKAHTSWVEKISTFWCDLAKISKATCHFGMYQCVLETDYGCVCIFFIIFLALLRGYSYLYINTFCIYRCMCIYVSITCIIDVYVVLCVAYVCYHACKTLLLIALTFRFCFNFFKKIKTHRIVSMGDRDIILQLKPLATIVV